MITKNFVFDGCIFFFILSLFESNFLINSVAGQNEETTLSTSVADIIHINAAPSPISIKNAQELEKSIEKAETALNELNQTLDHLIDYRFKLNKMEAEIDDKIFQDKKVLREVENKISNLRIIEKELDVKEKDLLVLEGQQVLLQQIIDENLKFYNSPAVIPEISKISFFAQRNSSFHHKMYILVESSDQNWRHISFKWYNHLPTYIRPYEINSLNEGRCFNANSGIFKAPFDGIYHFYFTALKMKNQDSYTSSLTVQIMSTKKGCGINYLKVLAEAHIDSADWYGWFPLQLQVTANLETDQEITVRLLDGSIYESGSLDHMLTSFGGFLVYRL